MTRDRQRDDENERNEELDDELEADVEDLDLAGGGAGVVGFVGGLLIGAVLGAGVALLLAPDRGEVTRRRIRSRFEEISDDAREQLEDWRDDAEREIRRRGRKLRRRVKARAE